MSSAIRVVMPPTFGLEVTAADTDRMRDAAAARAMRQVIS